MQALKSLGITTYVQDGTCIIWGIQGSLTGELLTLHLRCNNNIINIVTVNTTSMEVVTVTRNEVLINNFTLVVDYQVLIADNLLYVQFFYVTTLDYFYDSIIRVFVLNKSFELYKA